MRTGAQNVGNSKVGYILIIDTHSNAFSWTIVLSVSSLASLYGHWQMLARYIHDIPRIGEVRQNYT